MTASGGDASGIGGSSSYSIGQVFYSNYIGLNGSEAQGVQQASFIAAAGCTDSVASNYDSTAIIDDGSCSEPVLCPGDFSGDGFVNVSDLGGFLGAFGTECD